MSWKYRVPGRVELAGKHTDYAGGPSLTCATPMVMRASVQPRAGRVLGVRDLRSKRLVEIAVAPDAAPTPARWSVYLAAAARRVARDFPGADAGADVTLTSSIPSSAGLSSSSALVVTAVLALFDVNGLWTSAAWRAVAGDDLAFAQYCAAVESGAPWGPFAGDAGVGTRGGAQDHIAICASMAGMVGEYAYRPARVLRRVVWPSGWSIVVVHSGVKASKTGNARVAYNRAADAVRAMVAAWNAATGRGDETLAAALASGDGAHETMRDLAGRAADGATTAEYLRARLAQFVEETTVIVPGLRDAIAAADAPAAGRHMRRSQELAEQALENQVPETRWLAENAVVLGAAGATAFGAGFGGAVWALVSSGDASAFAKEWSGAFRRTFRTSSASAVSHVLRPAAGMTRDEA